MAEVKQLNNSIIVDKEFISEVWFLLLQLADEDVLKGNLTQFQELQEEAGVNSLRLAVKMSQQNCDLSEDVKSYGALTIFKQQGEVSV
tara:strand:- start:228 stop:491 length:264 start_codon:yes stop_codon:yes gene_type:complete